MEIKTIISMSTNKRLLMDKIIDILDSIAYEKGLKIDDVENALKEALIKTAQTGIIGSGISIQSRTKEKEIDNSFEDLIREN